MQFMETVQAAEAVKTGIQLVSAVLGTYGFCLLFNVTRRHIWAPVAAGGVCWASYLVLTHLGLSVFNATIISAAIVGIFGETAAHLCRMPTTVCFLPGCVPLIPGSNLYYALNGLVSRNWGELRDNSILLVEYAVGIAVGLALVNELDAVRSAVGQRIAERRTDA